MRQHSRFAEYQGARESTIGAALFLEMHRSHDPADLVPASARFFLTRRRAFAVARARASEFSSLTEPAQRELHLRGINFVAARKWFEANPLETGVDQ